VSDARNSRRGARKNGPHALSDAAQLKREIKSHIIRILNAPLRPDVAAGSGISTSQNGSGTRVIFIVWCQWRGKTTSIGKLANRLRQEDAAWCSAPRTRFAPLGRATGNLGSVTAIEVIKQNPAPIRRP